jgi:TonB family protein
MGNYKESKAIYEQVISVYPNTEAGILSWKLLDFIETMEGNREALEKQRLSEMEKARQFYLVMDFRNAIKNYSIFLGHSPAPELACEARFYKGRAHEELGETEDAIAEYRWVMNNDKKQEWARQASRRMLMIGQFYEQQKSITDEAKRQLTKYQDQIFLNNVQQYSKLISTSSLRSELTKDAKQASENSVKDSLLNAILNIGNLDLTGEKGAAAQQQKLDSIRNVLIDNGSISQAEVKELQRWQTVTQNPFRRPGVLKSTIDGYSNELKYIYNKRLRAGDKLSGKLLVEITILANGAVAKAEVQESDIGDVSFEKAVSDRILTWKFHAVQTSVGELKIKYPFEFTEEQQ